MKKQEEISHPNTLSCIVPPYKDPDIKLQYQNNSNQPHIKRFQSIHF